MSPQKFPPVEPLWPYGSVACFYPKTTPEGRDIGISELMVRKVSRRWKGGWRVTAETLPSGDKATTTITFDVDDAGESATCVPWDDELEAEYNPTPAERWRRMLLGLSEEKEAEQAEARRQNQPGNITGPARHVAAPQEEKADR